MSIHTVITGANRGIGLGLVKHYLANGQRVTAIVRDLDNATELKALQTDFKGLSLLGMDLGDTAAISKLTTIIEEPIDILINNAGVYGGSEQKLGEIDATIWQETFAINTLAPYFVTQALLPLMAKHAKIAFVSSKMGSIADNGSGGAYIYRSAKAALNAVVKSLSVDLASRGLNVVVLHPGWVKTRMGGTNAMISVEESVSGMTHVISTLDSSQSGQFVNYDGTEIPW